MKRDNQSKAASIVCYALFLVIVIIMFDVFILHNILGYGYPRHYEEENIERYPHPYVEFTGKPYAMSNNEYGFRGPSFKESKPNDLKIAFFGGSTGYYGNPPIADIVGKELEKLLGISVFVANYSVVSSNHRQHLHGIIEFLPQFKPDLVVFYGGYNETFQHTLYDPRPGYPYNYFYRSGTGSFFKLLLEHSAIIGEVDKRTGIFTGLAKLRKEQQLFSDDWNMRIVDKYFETLMLANSVAKTIGSQKFGTTKFFAFYQPYQVSKEFMPVHNEIKNRINTTEYVFDVSSEYDVLGKGIYYDLVHVNQPAKEVMGGKIAEIIAHKLQVERVIIEK